MLWFGGTRRTTGRDQTDFGVSAPSEFQRSVSDDDCLSECGYAEVRRFAARQDAGEEGYSVPNKSVAADENQPPVPLTQAIRASGTCRSPASPRNCLIASTIKNMPRMPG